MREKYGGRANIDVKAITLVVIKLLMLASAYLSPGRNGQKQANTPSSLQSMTDAVTASVVIALCESTAEVVGSQRLFIRVVINVKRGETPAFTRADFA